MERVSQLKSEIETLETQYNSNVEIMKKIESEAMQKINETNKQNGTIRDRWLRLSGAVEELERQTESERDVKQKG